MDSSKVGKFTWRIENFSSIKDTQLHSASFCVGDNKWRLLIFPKGKKIDHLSIYVDVVDSATLPKGWSRYAQFRLTVINQIDCKASITKDSDHEFNAEESDWGFSSFMPLSDLLDSKRGYLVNDICVVEAYLCTDRTIDLLSEIEMEKFFASLESELISSNFVSSQGEVKEALSMIDEALNMAPANFYVSGMISSLRKAFKLLSSFDCSSTLTIEQKNELLAMEDNFKQLPERAVKALKNKNLLIEKESIQLKLTRNLEQSLIKFKEAKAELKEAEQKIAALFKLVNEAQTNKENVLAGQKEIFKSSQDCKAQLDTLGKEWPEYVAKAKLAEEEEKAVEAQWGRMKDFISSLKKKDLKETN